MKISPALKAKRKTIAGEEKGRGAVWKRAACLQLSNEQGGFIRVYENPRNPEMSRRAGVPSIGTTHRYGYFLPLSLL